MVGMSGKSGETRRTGRTGGASMVAPSKKVDHPPQPVVKPKASAEQVNIANILGDSNALPTNMEERIAQVMAVVSSKSEEEVTIALHDNDYCVETAIDTLLDSSSDLKDVWSQPVTRKNKKKSVVENDPVLVITDTSSKTTTPQGAGGHTGGSRVNPRAAAQHTRENYGGTVTVVEHPRGAGKGGGRDRGRSQSSGKSRKEKGENKQEGKDGEGRRGKGDQRTERERGDDYKSERGGGGRESSGGGNGGRRDRGEKGDRRSNGGSRPRRRDQKPKEGGANNTSGSTSFSRHRHTKERWSTEPATGDDIETTQQQQPKEQKQPPVPTTSAAVWFSSSRDVWQGEVSLNPQEQWETRHPPAPQAPSSQSCSVFPEALLAQPGVTTPPATPPVIRDEVHTEEPVTKAPPTRTNKRKSRTRKYLPSQIPSEPVEMPSGVDTVSLKMSSLGIDFMSKEPLSSPTVTEITPIATTPTTRPYESSLHSPQPALLSNPVPSGGALLPTPTYPSTFPTDSSVLPIPSSLEATTSPFPSQQPATPVSSHTEALASTLEPPPGLTHPSKHSEKSTTPSHLQQGLLPEPLTLPTHSTQATPTDMLSSHIPSAPKPSLAQLPTPSASYPSPLGSMALTPETTPSVKMPQQSSGVSYAAPAPSTTSASNPHTSSEPLFSNKPPQTNVPTVAARQHHTGGPTNTASSSAGGLISASSVNPQRSSGKQHGGGNVQHPAMLYQPTAPGMMPYYTHAPPVVMPPPYAGAPYTDMERYPFYPQHATSQEQAPSSVNRDHVSSSYATDAASKQLDMATAISSSALPQQQQQQQQGALQHPYYYPHPSHSNMLYSLYAAQMQAAQAQAAQFQMGHKPGVTTTFATSYQHNPQFSGLTGYEDNAAQDYKHFPGGSSLGKSSNVPSTSTVSDFQQQYKFEKQQQQQPGYGYPVPHQSTYLGGPAGFMPMVPHPLMTTPHETSSRPKHGGKTPYMAQSTNTLF